MKEQISRPLVSVIMPCFNAEKTLAITLESLLAQTYTNWELIAIDDGSIDATASILAEFCTRFSGRMQIILQQNSGQTLAKNKAIENSSGSYIALLDSDDLWHQEKLTRQIAFMQANPDVALCYTEGIYINENGAQCGSFDSTSEFRGRCFRRLLLGNNIVASSVMIRRQALDEVGIFDPELRACENWELWTRIAQIYAIDYLAEPLTSYRQHANNMMKNLEKMRAYRLLTIQKNEKRYAITGRDLKRLFHEAYFSAYAFFGKNYLWNLDMSSARRDLWQAIKLKPTALSCYKAYCKTLLGARLNNGLRTIKRRLAYA